MMMIIIIMMMMILNIIQTISLLMFVYYFGFIDIINSVIFIFIANESVLEKTKHLNSNATIQITIT